MKSRLRAKFFLRIPIDPHQFYGFCCLERSDIFHLKLNFNFNSRKIRKHDCLGRPTYWIEGLKRLKMDGPESGRFRKWALPKVNDPETRRPWLWMVPKLDDPESGLSRKWTAQKVDGHDSEWPRKLTILKLNSPEIGQSWKWAVLKVDGPESGQSLQMVKEVTHHSEDLPILDRTVRFQDRPLWSPQTVYFGRF